MPRQIRSHAAFTLVELLVVIVIIGMLMALLLPAVNAVREAGRRTSCTNNLFQMALAMSRYSNATGNLPGWRNALPTTSGTIFPSWPVMILPNMERNDVYKAWQAGNLASPYISFFSCPSSPPDALTGPTLAYVGSAGAGSNAAGLRGSGVMLDVTATGNMAASVSMDDVANGDGAATTLLLSEECGRLITSQGSWNVQPAQNGSVVTWNSITPVFGLVGTTVPAKVINSGTLGSATVPGASNMPSSNHPGGAVVAFCDGHTGFLKDPLQARVYAQLMSWTTGTTAPYSTWVGSYLLQEGDYQ